MNAKELQDEIDRRRAALQPALREIAALEQQQAVAASREFIAEHGITASMVQTSSIEGTWHGTVGEFGKWMERNGCTKPWAEWNGRLYPSLELKAGRMRSDAPGLAEHVAP